MIRLLVALALLAGCSHHEDSNGAHYIALPDSLREISGLASASADSVFAHDDERGIVHEISVDDGEVIRSFALGNPAIEADFEGIAADGNRLWIITSEGAIFAFRAGANGTHVAYEEYESGVGDYCEIEGLSLSPNPDSLLIACKRMLQGPRRGTLVIYEWDTRRRRPVDTPWREIGLAEALGEESGEFAPSGIEWLPDYNQILVIAARGRSMLVLDEGGRIVSRHRISAGRHPQPEGVTVVGSNRLVIADEGPVGTRGQIAVYRYPLR
ncbi:MAG: hypothetical protein RLN87_06820 [Parasphingopyxis sp.]|uniref:esterase-like activity of phytase family protein n=1 Tax=Parasphingopyxis sp. TaxID=1920299 RepID=UPI0032F03972